MNNPHDDIPASDPIKTYYAGRRQAFKEAIAVVEKELPGIDGVKYEIRKQLQEKIDELK